MKHPIAPDLYPEPKTDDQKQQDLIDLHKTYRDRWPKYPQLNVALYGIGIFYAIFWYIQNLGKWLNAGSGELSGELIGQTMNSVFTVFITGLVISYLLIVWCMYVNRLFSFFGGSQRTFWIIYAIFVIILIIIWQLDSQWSHNDFIWIPVLSVIHGLGVFLIAKFSIVE